MSEEKSAVRPRPKRRSKGRRNPLAAFLSKRSYLNLNPSALPTRRLPNQERKFIASVGDENVVTSTGTVAPLSLCAQGSDITNRIGDTINVVNWRLSAHATGITVTSPQFLRLLVVRDGQCNGATPSVADILQDPTDDIALHSPITFINTTRFEVLGDAILVICSGPSEIATSAQVVKFQDTRPFSIRYVGTTALAASQGRNSLFLLAISDTAATSPLLTFFSTITFQD